VTLSPAGAAFLTEAKAVIEAVERARVVAGEATIGLRGSIRIGTLTAVTALDLPGLVGAFKTHHPFVDVQVRASGSGSAGIAEDVRRSRLDIGIVALDTADAPGVDLRPLATVPYVVLLPAGHRLAGSEDVALTDLAGEDFIDSPRGFGNRITLDRAYAQLGVTRRTQVEISDIRTAAGYVRAISGVAVLPNFALPEDSGVLIKPLRGPNLTMTLSFAVTADRRPGPTVAALLALSGDYVRENKQY
jgi:DNA-binding transcriptional LysR family regulator